MKSASHGQRRDKLRERERERERERGRKEVRKRRTKRHDQRDTRTKKNDCGEIDQPAAVLRGTTLAHIL